jgi:antitoxin component YwqK of YwqJK toxin-antitoxin module
MSKKESPHNGRTTVQHSTDISPSVPETQASKDQTPTQGIADSQSGAGVTQLSGDPSVKFETLAIDHIDYNTGPQGQNVYEVEENMNMNRRRLYRGQDGKLYEHGTQVLRVPGGRVIKTDNYVYGRLHGESKEFWADGSVNFKTTYHNGDVRHQEGWGQNGVKLLDYYMLNGEKHGLEVEYDGVGGILGKTLYEHGAVVKKELFDAESVIPK